MAAKVTQMKDKDFDMIEPRVGFNDTAEERFNKIVQACRDAYSKCNPQRINGVEMQHDGELKYFKDMAAYIKKRIEEDEKGTSGWHVIVGKI